MPTADLKRGHSLPFLLDIIRLEVVTSEHLSANSAQICRKPGDENVLLEPSSLAVMGAGTTAFRRFELDFEVIFQLQLSF